MGIANAKDCVKQPHNPKIRFPRQAVCFRWADIRQDSRQGVFRLDREGPVVRRLRDERPA